MERRDPDGVLVTRPAEAGAQTGALLRAAGWRPVMAPMLDIAPLPAALPEADAVQAVLITSAHAAPMLPARLHATKLLAVGDATAAQARAAGFAHVMSADGDAAALAALAAEQCDRRGLPLLLAGAAGQGGPLIDLLSAGGFRVLHHSVYTARPVRELSDVVRQELYNRRISAALFYSPATARSFVAAFLQACHGDIVLNVDALAISAAAAAALAPLPWRRIRVARRPNQDELLALLP
jgi:uroporphyrinogen-III synthase